jgi:hypothetical protein
MLLTSDSVYIGDRRFIKAKKRIEKYEKFANKKFDDLLNQSQDISVFDKPSVNELSSFSVTPHTQKSILPSNHHAGCVDNYLPTDFVKLKSALKRGTPEERTSIINALYWRILKSKDKSIRKLNILGLLYHDVLGLKSADFSQMLAYK